MKISEVLFARFQYLAKYYAKKVYHLEKIAYEQDDILQDFRIKLYEVILCYGRSWSRYKQTGRRKPIPMRFYIKSALANKVYDYISKIEGKHGADNSRRAIVLNGNSFESIDYGVNNPNYSEISYENNTYMLSGIDLLGNLNPFEKRIYSMYLKGTSVKKLHNTFKSISVNALIHKQKVYLSQFKNALIPEQENNFTCVKFLQE